MVLLIKLTVKKAYEQSTTANPGVPMIDTCSPTPTVTFITTGHLQCTNTGTLLFTQFHTLDFNSFVLMFFCF